MTSKRNARSNRQNARRSTGPRSQSGKRASSQNARRHGLAAARDKDWLARAGAIVDVLVGSEASNLQRVHAESAADATLELQAIKELRRREVESRVNALRWRFPAMNLALAKAIAIAEAAIELGGLHRYERRALSRRKAAIRQLDASRRG